MVNVFKKKIKFHVKSDEWILVHEDAIECLKNIKSNSIDMIFADPPYFLSNDGISVSGGKQVSVNKATWDMGFKFKEKNDFNKKWIKQCKRILKTDGTIWISGSMHNIYSVGYILENEGFKILNNITWRKTNPPPNLACRCFTHSTETILWAKKDVKSKHTFNYKIMKEMNGGKQMKDVWEGSLTSKKEKVYGKHPTQKPEYILEKIILSSTNEGDIVLDPFNGSGTTGVVAQRFNRKYIGIDFTMEYLELTEERIKGDKGEE